MRIAPIVLIATLFSCSSEKEQSDNTPPKAEKPSGGEVTPNALDLTGFKYSNFHSAPWDKKCDAVSSFFENYRALYLDKGVTSEVSPCNRSMSDGLTSQFHDIILTASDGSKVEFRFSSFITINDDLAIAQDEFTLFQIKDVTVDFFTYDDEKHAVFGEDMRHITTTFQSWSRYDNQPIEIFGRSYSDFVREVTEKGLDTFAGKITFEASEASIAKGTVKFKSIRDEAFRGYNDFLGCSKEGVLECLNDGKSKYHIAGNHINISREIGNSSDGVSQSVGERFTISTWE